MSAHTPHQTVLMRGLDRALAAAGSNSTLRLPEGIDPAEVAAAPYAGPPVVELRKRLDADGRGEDHTDAYRRLIGELGIPATLSVIAGLDDDYDIRAAVTRLTRLGFFPLDDTLFDLVADREPEFAVTVVGEVLDRTRGQLEVTCGALVGFARTHRAGAWWLFHRLRWFTGEVPDAVLPRVVALVADQVGDRIESALPLVKYPHYLLSDEQTRGLLAQQTLPALTTAVAIGRVFGPVTGEAAAQRGGLAMLLEQDNSGVQVPAAFLARPAVEELSPAGARRVLDQVALPADQPDLLIDLLERADGAFSWLVGSYPLNRPTSETIRLARQRGLVDGALLVDRGQFRVVHHRDWFPAAVAETPGVAPALLKLLVDVGTGHPQSESASGAAVMLEVVAEALGDSTDLWQRFLAAAEDPKSPFANPALTVAEAATVLTSRWDRARQRLARQGR